VGSGGKIIIGMVFIDSTVVNAASAASRVEGNGCSGSVDCRVPRAFLAALILVGGSLGDHGGGAFLPLLLCTGLSLVRSFA